MSLRQGRAMYLKQSTPLTLTSVHTPTKHMQHSLITLWTLLYHKCIKIKVRYEVHSAKLQLAILLDHFCFGDHPNGEFLSVKE